MAYSYKGAISFGLIYIPITLHAAVKNNDVSFNLLDKNTKSRIQYKKTCVDCNGKTVRQEDIVKGYEYEEDKYVIFEDKDFEAVKSKKDKNITIEQFVDIAEIDPLFYDRAFYVVPTGAEHAFALLVAAMEKQGKVGIARAVMGTKESLIAIRAKNGQMMLNTMYFSEEIQKNPLKEIKTDINGKELEMASALIENMGKPFKAEEYKDTYRQKLLEAIEAKIEGKNIVAPKEKQSNRVINLMEALEKSLAEYKSKPVPRSKKAAKSKA